MWPLCEGTPEIPSADISKLPSKEVFKICVLGQWMDGWMDEYLNTPLFIASE